LFIDMMSAARSTFSQLSSLKDDVVQLARLRVTHEGDVVGLGGARQPDRQVGLAVFHQHVLDQVEAQHLLEDLLHLLDVRAVQQAVVHSHRGDAALGVGNPGIGVDVGLPLPTSVFSA
jgi:hypothetical protein